MPPYFCILTYTHTHTHTQRERERERETPTLNIIYHANVTDLCSIYQEDIFTLPAIELGQLKKVKIRHDNKGGMAAWFLNHIEIDDPKNKQKYVYLII